MWLVWWFWIPSFYFFSWIFWLTFGDWLLDYSVPCFNCCRFLKSIASINVKWRTDGKKWRHSRDTIPNQKYCEMHMHRGAKKRVEPKNPVPKFSIDTTSSPFLPSTMITSANADSATSDSILCISVPKSPQVATRSPSSSRCYHQWHYHHIQQRQSFWGFCNSYQNWSAFLEENNYVSGELRYILNHLSCVAIENWLMNLLEGQFLLCLFDGIVQ